MRLIDADALMDIIVHRSYSVTDYWNNRDAGMFLFGIEQAVNEQPTVDAVPVIRCKECKWLGVANLKDRYGQPYPVPCCRGKGNILLGITPDDYCSRAERKEE